jgi:hypothetical protein
MVVSVSARLKQLYVEQDYLLKMIDDLEKKAQLGTTSDFTYTMLRKKYETSLVNVEEEIFKKKHERKRQKKVRRKRKTKAKAAPKENPNVIRIKKQKKRVAVSHLRRQYALAFRHARVDNERVYARSLSSHIIDTLWIHQNSGRLLTAQELIQQLQNSDPTFNRSRDAVLDSLRRLVSEGRIKRFEKANRVIQYKVLI